MTSLKNSSHQINNDDLISINKNSESISKDSEKNQIDKNGNRRDYLIRDIFLELEKPKGFFKADIVYTKIENYVQIYHRFFYSTISNIIYAYFDANKDEKIASSLLANIDELVAYSEEKGEDKTTYIPILKLWDHANLANRQYKMLKLSDEEYKSKFRENTRDFKIKFKTELSKEINSQMMIMVSIFTALAFLIFGSLSSLDGIFEMSDLPLAKASCIACLWGLCVSNMIFLFLYCAGKMTNLSSNDSGENGSFLKRNKLYFISNSILLLLFLIFLAFYNFQSKKVNRFENNSLNDTIFSKCDNCSSTNSQIKTNSIIYSNDSSSTQINTTNVNLNLTD